MTDADLNGVKVALRFLVRRLSLFTIPKTSSLEHAAENRGGRGAAADAGRARPDRPGVPGRPPAAPASHAVGP